MAIDDTQQSIWNFDGAEMYAIFEIKKEFMNCLLNWDLEGSFWKVRILRMELDAKLKRGFKKAFEEIEEEKAKTKGRKREKKKTEKEEVDEMLQDLEEVRKKYLSIEEPEEEDTSNYYKKLENFYMHLCHIMKTHGMYFREGEDMTLAVLRR